MVYHFFFGGGGGGFTPFGGGGGGVLPAGFPGGGGGTFAPGFPGGGGAFPAGLGAWVGFPGWDAGLGADFAWVLGAYFPPAFFSSFFASTFGSSFFSAAGVWLGFPFFTFPKSSSVSSGRISVTTPAAMVLPPSLKANLDPFSMVSGKWSLALMVRLSPGFPNLVPSGRRI